MRKTKTYLISNHLFEKPEDRDKLPTSCKKFLTEVEFCYRQWIGKPFASRKEIEDILVDGLGVDRKRATYIMTVTFKIFVIISPIRRKQFDKLIDDYKKTIEELKTNYEESRNLGNMLAMW